MLSEAVEAYEKETGLYLDKEDIVAIRKALNLGFTVSEISLAARNARKFYFVNECRVSRTIGDRLAAKTIFKDAQTVRGFIGYDNSKTKTVSYLRERIQAKKLYTESV